MKRLSIIFILLFICLVSCLNNKKEELKTNDQKRILFITSSAHFYGQSDIESTNHFPEIILAYDVFKKEGFKIDFVSPKGGAIPIGYIYSSDSITKEYLYDGHFMNKLKNTKSPNEINSEDYLGVYYSGGGSAMFTVPENLPIQKIVMNIYEKNNGIISAICHGTAGLANLKMSDGNYLIRDKNVSGFPDEFEDLDAKYYKEFPFSIQNMVEERGGSFKFSENGWDGFMVSDGRLVTGQDPSGSALVAKKVIEIIRSKNN
jgi:putative intracellular protease/amidase